VSYRFKVRAKNYWGWGPVSTILTIKAATFPNKPNAPTTFIDSATGGLRVEWVAPYANSDTITAYQLQALKKDGATWFNICDGSNATVVSLKKCIEPMATFYDPLKLNLAFQDLIKVKVLAINVNGPGSYSDSNTTGETVRTVPRFMNAPLRGVLTSDSQLVVYWTTITTAA